MMRFNIGKAYFVFTVLLLGLPTSAPCQESYKFERMWPVLKQPWYFFKPSDLARDSFGNIYVTDWGHNRVLKFTQDGAFITSWGREGTGSREFKGPRGIAIHEKTVDDELFIYVYVADSGNSRVQKFTSDGSFIWKRRVVRETGEAGLLLNRIAIDTEGYLYITDYDNNCVKKLSEATDPLTTVTKWGSIDSGDFKWPQGIAVDVGGNIYVADNGNDRIQRIDQDDNTISPWYGYGSGQGTFDEPFGITLDDVENIYVTNNGNGIIQKFSPDGTMASWAFDGKPDGIAVVPDGYIYVSEWTESVAGTTHKRIVRLSPDGISLSIWASEGEVSGKFNQPFGIALREEAGETSIYVSDTFNNRIQKFNSGGAWVQTWGRPDWMFNYPEGIAIDATGSIYVADENNHRIRKINPDDSSVTWSLGATYYPYGVAVDADGENIYIAAREGILFYRVLKLDPDTGDFAVWGSGLNQPHGVTVGPDGYIYVADTGNNLIKKCDPADGSCTVCASGLSGPWGVAVDTSLNIYVADTENDRVKIFYPDGHSISVGRPGNMPGQFSFPTNLAVGPDGKIYVSDTGNNRIQVFKPFEVLTHPRAIIVAGGGPYPGNNLWDATQVCSNMAYRTLIHRGFTDDDIYYLSADTGLDLDNDGEAEVDGLPTVSNLQSAITQWALNENAESLIVYLNDHGGPYTFRLHEGNDGILSSATLAFWLDEFQAFNSGKVAAIYEACESGSFIDDLKGDGRIIITSTLPGEQAKFLSQGTLSFSSFFWTHILNGLSIGDSYLHAKDIVNFAFSNQNPQLNGDAQNIYIGSGVLGMLGAPPVIGNVSEPLEIAGEGTTAVLSAGGVTDPDGIARVWAVIWPPDYVPGSSENPLLTRPSCELLPVGDDLYEGEYHEFSKDGTYQIAIYAMDRNNNTSLPQLTTVSRNYRVERKAIIIAGWGSSDYLTSSFATNAGIAYDALRYQGYSDSDIYLMSVTGFRLEVDAGAYSSNLEYELTRLTNDPAIENLDLTIYLIGEGNTGSFTMNGESPVDLLYSSRLYGWLDTLQAVKPGRLKIIYDGDKSGSFIIPAPPSSPGERIVIASSTKDGQAYFSGAGDICFSSFFWSQVAGGATLYDAVSHAKKAISYLSRKDQIAFTCYEEQTPQIEASGNGVANEEADYRIARARTIGIGLKTAADPPHVGSVSLESTEGTIIITAKEITSTSPVERVWAVIEPIGYCPGFSGGAAAEMPEIELEDPDQDGRYEGTTTDPAIAFKVVVHAVDEEGNTSSPRETRIYQAEGGDIYEFDNTRRRSNVIVIDHPVPQPHNFHYSSDEDWVRFYGVEGEYYTITAGNLGAGCAPVIELYYRNETTPEIVETVSISFECLTSGFYYVRLFNSTSGEDTDYELSVYHPYWPDALTLITGRVEERSSRDDIDGAVITTTPGGGSAISVGGEYAFMQKPGDWWMDAVKSGYSFNGVDLTVETGVEFMQRDILMNSTRAACDQDKDCDDGLFCNGIEVCVAGDCQDGSLPCSDDGLFCNGVETCDEGQDSCVSPENPCQGDLRCDEEINACVDCTGDGDCDDGEFCNGVETCVETVCQDGTSPCPEGVECDEEGDECLNPHISIQPQSMLQSRWMPLIVFLRINGTYTHFDGTSEVTFSPSSLVFLPFVWGEEMITGIGLMMPSFLTEPHNATIEVKVKTGVEQVSGIVEVKVFPLME